MTGAMTEPAGLDKHVDPVTAELKERVIRAIDELAPEIIDVSLQIHAHPEPAFHEEFAADLLSSVLERHGLVPQRAVHGLETSFRCELGSDGPVVAILSEYDALPGLGHGCGHNLIAAMGLGATLGLASLGDIGGGIRYLGTPAEEAGCGKAIMAEHGAFDGVAAALMVHPSSVDLEDIPSLAFTEVTAVFHGVSAHASTSANVAINALDACVSAYQNIAQLRQHITWLERIHGIITSGGSAPNVIPDRAEARFYIRAENARTLAKLAERVTACLEGGAAGAGATVELTWWDHAYLDLQSDPELFGAYRRNAESLGRTFMELSELPAGARGSTDMGNVSHIVPAIHPAIGNAEQLIAPHSEDFVHYAASPEAAASIIDGAKAMAMTAIDFLHDADFRNAVAQGFAGRRAAVEEGP